MKLACLLTASLLLPALAQAHPGHDGHELTWDFHMHGAWEVSALALIAAAGTWLYLRKRSRQ